MTRTQSKVEEMPLDTTVTFVEARKTGKMATKILGGKLASSQLNQVQDRVDLRHCNYCGKKGHGKSANFDTRKANARPMVRSAPNASVWVTMPQFASPGRETRRTMISPTPRRQPQALTKSHSTG
jgi:hypothetical protein